VAIELPPPASAAVASDAGDRLASLMDEPVTEGLSEMLAELLDRTAEFASLRPRVEATYRALLELGELERAAQLAEVARTVAVDPRRPPEARAAAEACLATLTGPDHMSPLVDALEQTSASAAVAAQRLLEALGPAVIRTFLLALAEETDRARRRRLLDLLGAIGLAVVPDATLLLSDERWYVVRNMVLLLRTVGDRGSLEAVRRLALHTDLRVRLEAIKTLLEFKDERSRALLEAAINDADPALSEAAIELSGEYGIGEAREPLLVLLAGSDLRGRRRGARLKALRALADLGDTAVLPRLRHFFEEPLLPLVAVEERRAAFRSLEAYPAEARRCWIDIGLGSRDALIRSVCWRIFRLDSPDAAGGETPA
jgi:HEAT repeat protein